MSTINRKDKNIFSPKFFNREKELSDNPQERKEKGAFYTPMPIVEFMNRAVEDILSDALGEKDGFGSDKIKVLDFAAGTGIFICDAIERAFKSGKSVKKIYKTVQENFYAYELDPKSHEVLLENISEIFERYGFAFKPDNIKNINTLTEEGDAAF